MERKRGLRLLGLLSVAAVLLCGCTGSNRPPRTTGDFGLEATLQQEGSVQSLEWSPDGLRIASVAYPAALNLWDAARYSLCATIPRLGAFTGRPAWSPDGGLIAIAETASPWRIAVHKTASGALLVTLGAPDRDRIPEGVFSMSWSPNGSRLAAGTMTGTILVFETIGWRLVNSIEPFIKGSPSRPCGAVAYSPDGRTLACSDAENVSLREAATGRFLCNVTCVSPVRILWSPDGGRLGFSGNRVLAGVVNLATGEGATNRSDDPYAPRPSEEAYALSPDFCWSAHADQYSSSRTNPIHVEPMGWRGEGKSLLSHARAVRALAWSPGSDRLASGSVDGSIKLWSRDTDRDMYADVVDRFPEDRTQWNDTDRDGYGDNQNGRNPDVFPTDPREWKDTDGDGMGDNGDPLRTVHNVVFAALVGISAVTAALLYLLGRWIKKRRTGRSLTREEGPVPPRPYQYWSGPAYPGPPKRP